MKGEEWSGGGEKEEEVAFRGERRGPCSSNLHHN